MRSCIFLSSLLLLSTTAAVLPCLAEEAADNIDLGQEYEEHERGGAAVPKKEKRPVWKKLLFYLPSRVLDLVDIVHADAGVGFATGVVVRATKWGQVGYRAVSPASLRVGLQGRNLPIFIERSSEFGAGPLFLQSHDREVTPLEFGVGADLILAGAYLGVSIDEFFDFLGGWIGIDFKDDDL